MTRTREWTKLGILVVVTILLAVAFAAAVDLPRVSTAQARTPVIFSTAQAPTIPAAQPAAELGDAFAAVAEAVRQTVVYIAAESEQSVARQVPDPLREFFGDPNDPQTGEPRIRTGSGSGFIISEDGYIITNNHVVADARKLTVRLLDRREFSAEVVGRDPNTDIAVIKIDANDLKPAVLGTSDGVRIGEWALAVGNPLGEAFSFTITAGIVSGRGRQLQGLRRQDQAYTIQDFIQTDAAINPGNSGGPLVNIRGEVIGVNSAIASRTGTYTGYGFAVPIDLAKAVAQQLIEDGRVRRAVLGISIRNADAEDAAYVGLDSIFGVLVSELPDASSPAARAGIKAGDVIVAVDGKHVSYTAQLQQEIGFRKPGDDVNVTVARRGGERQTYAIRLDEAPDVGVETVARSEPRPRNGDAKVEPKLGVSLREETSQSLARQNLPGDLAGLRVTDVSRDGTAFGKLFPDDIITHIEDGRIRTEQDLDAVLTSASSGDILSVRVVNVGGEPRARLVRVRVGADR